MGGITGFSSLADGYLRLDPSGRGTKRNTSLVFDQLIQAIFFVLYQVDQMTVFLINRLLPWIIQCFVRMHLVILIVEKEKCS